MPHSSTFISLSQNMLSLHAALQKDLRARGHELKPLDSDYGNMQAIYWNRQTGQVIPASDPRGVGDARVGMFRTK